MATFKVFTNTVTESMQQKLIQIGLYSNSPTLGLDPKTTAFAMAIARLYYADSEGKFHSMKVGGVLCLVADRRLHSRFLRLFDINSGELLFQTELYLNFHLVTIKLHYNNDIQTYREFNDYFFSFPLEKVNIGVQFANVHDASFFRTLITNYSFKGESLSDIVKTHKSKLGVSNIDISKPIAFERKEHAGWNPESQTFILNEVPKEIKMLLKKAGFKKKDLKKKETALAIYEILLREVEFETSAGGNSGGLAGRTSSNMGGRGSSENSRIMGGGSIERTGSIMNFGFNHLTSQNNIHPQNHNMMSSGQDFLDSKLKSNLQIPQPPGINNRNSSNAKDKSLNASPDHREEFKKGPPLPPPMMGIIPPPPMGIAPSISFPPPPMMGGKLIPPPPMNGPNSLMPPTNGAVNAPTLSFTEQLMQQSQNLKKVTQENQVNTKVKNLSESQQMKITMNLAVVLEQRKKALQNDDKGKNDSDVDSEEEDNDSDGSAW